MLRAVGVKAEVKKTYDKNHNHDVWYIVATTNALASEAVHEAVRRAVVEFLELCREAGAIGVETYRYLATKLERGVPEWGEIRFSAALTKSGTVAVVYRSKDLQSIREAANFLRGLGMRDSCEGKWCVVHFKTREPEGGRLGYVRITVDGLKYIGWLALHGGGEARERARWLKEMLLKEAGAKGGGVRRRLMQYFRKGERWGTSRP